MALYPDEKEAFSGNFSISVSFSNLAVAAKLDWKKFDEKRHLLFIILGC